MIKNFKFSWRKSIFRIDKYSKLKRDISKYLLNQVTSQKDLLSKF
jgi:hypothetical protein